MNLLSRITGSLRERELVDLEKSQWWSYDRLVAFQGKRLRKILSYAYRHIPAYRSKFEAAGIHPRDIRSAEDLVKIPVTTRGEMQENPDFVNKTEVSGTLYTGGSTGTSLRYYESRLAGMMRWNSHLRGWGWNGYRYGRDALAVVSSSQGIIEGDRVINLFGELTDDNIGKNVEVLLEKKPPYLRGYVSSLYILSRYCIDHGITLGFIRSVNTISENLYPYQRESMEQAFRCRVFEEYVCNDGGACAWECDSHTALHHAMERAVIEEVDGEMVVTDLWNTAMPFIRYRNGDTVKFLGERCTCGRQLPLISVSGRSNDIIISPHGPVSPSFLIHHGAGLVGADKKTGSFRSGIREVQYVQEPGYVLVVNIVKNPWCTPDEIVELEHNVREIARGMAVEVHVVEQIPASPKGKRQFILNRDESALRRAGFL